MGIPGRPEMLAAADATDDSQTAEDLIAQLKKAVFQGRIRMNQFFTDFDPLRSGVVSAHKFRTALVASGLTSDNRAQFSEKQLQLLHQYYVDPTDPQRVRYVDLLKELDSVFTTDGMQYDPHSKTTDFTPSLVKDEIFLDPASEAAVQAVIERLSHTVKTKMLLVRQPFDDYMRHVNSPMQVDCCTFAQFRNGLSRLGLEVSGPEADLIKMKFAGSSPGYVNYVAFVCAIDEGERVFSTRLPQSDLLASNRLHGGFRQARTVRGGEQPGRMANSSDAPKLEGESAFTAAESTVESIIYMLQDKALQHRLRVSEFFRDGDKHHDGTVTVPQFVKSLNNAFDKMHVGLSEREVGLLVTRYRKTMAHGNTHVQWRLFANDIEAAFTKAGLEKTPTLKPDVRLLQHGSKTLAPASREAAVQSLLKDLRSRVLVRRVLVKPFFDDFEKQVNSAKVVDHITRQQTLQAFSRFGVELSAAQAELLFERYDSLGDGTVNYVALVTDVDPYENFSQRKVSHHVFPQDPQYTGTTGIPPGGFWKDRVLSGPLVNFQPGRPRTDNDMPRCVAAPTGQSAAEVIERLRNAALRSRMRVEEAFKDFDRHRCGSITIPQFTIAMQMTFGRSEPLSQADFETLVSTYSVEKPGCVHVKWKEIVDEINHGANPTKAHRAPQAPVVTYAPPPRDLPDLDAASEETLAKVLAKFRHFCFTRRVLVKPYFQDAERNRRSMRKVDHVTRPQFEACLARLGLEASNEELDILVKKFDDNFDGYVNYVAFVRTVDVYETFSDRKPEGKPEAKLYATNGGFKAVKTASTQPGRAPPQMDFPRLFAEKPPMGGVPEIMHVLQTKCLQYSVSPHDFFVDYDRTHKGSISIPQFRAALFNAFGASYIKCDVTEADCQRLEEHYAAPLLDGDTHVKWKIFCDDLLRAVVPSGMEYTPTREVSERVIERQERFLTPQEEAAVAALLETMRKRFEIRCVYVKGPFHDFALSTNSPKMIDHVTRQQFVQGLARLGVEPSAEDLQLLFKKFDDDGVGNVNYVAFSRAVDALETFSDRNKAAIAKRSTFYGGFRKPKVPLDFLASA